MNQKFTCEPDAFQITIKCIDRGVISTHERRSVNVEGYSIFCDRPFFIAIAHVSRQIEATSVVDFPVV